MLCLGYLQEPTHKQPVIVAGKDVKEVDNDYFLIPVSIKDHEGPLRTTFPVENRLLPQGTLWQRQFLNDGSSKKECTLQLQCILLLSVVLHLFVVAESLISEHCW